MHTGMVAVTQECRHAETLVHMYVATYKCSQIKYSTVRLSIIKSLEKLLSPINVRQTLPFNVFKSQQINFYFLFLFLYGLNSPGL